MFSKDHPKQQVRSLKERATVPRTYTPPRNFILKAFRSPGRGQKYFQRSENKTDEPRFSTVSLQPRLIPGAPLLEEIRLRVWNSACTLTVFSILLNCPWVSASTLDRSQTSLAGIQAKLHHAEPRDRCILEAMLVNRMMDMAGRQLESGDSESASQTLKQVQAFLNDIQSSVKTDSKKLKDAELLIRQSSFRLKDILRASSPEDKLALEGTSKQLDAVEQQLMMLVFSR
jgi:hypothetical protein